MNAILIHMAECCLRVSLIAAVALGCVGLVGRRRPAARATISAVSLISILFLTLLAAAPLPIWWRWELSVPRNAANPSDNSTQPLATDASSFADGRGAVALDSQPGGVTFDLTAAARWLAGSTARSTESVSADWRTVVMMILAAGAAFGILRLGWSLATALRVGRRGYAIPDPHVHAWLAEIAGRLDCTNSVSLRESAQLSSAATVGWPRATIVLPIDWREWSGEELRCVLAHELAHVVRRDFATRCAALLSGALHFYHPLVRWLARRIVLDQELAADELAARAVGTEMSYLQGLSRLALREDDRSRSASIAGVLPVFSGFLIRRIEMLRVMEGRYATFRKRPGWIAGGLLVALAISAAGVRGTAAPPPGHQTPASTESTGGAPASESLAAGEAFRRTPVDPSAVVLPGVPPEHAFSHGAYVIRVAECLKRPGLARTLRETLAPALVDRMDVYWKDMFESDETPDIGFEDIDCIVGNLHLTLTPIGDMPAGAPGTPAIGQGAEARRFVLGSNLVHIRLRKRLDWRQLERCLPSATRERHEGVVFLKVLVPELGAAPFFVFQADERTVAIACSEDVARRVIEHRSTRPATAAWIAHWKAADGGLVTFLAPSPAAALSVVDNDLETGWLVPSSEVQPGPIRVQPADPNGDRDHSRFIAMLDKSPCIAGGIDWADDSDILQLKLHLACGTETRPQEARDVLAEVIAPMRKAALDAPPGQVSSQLAEFLKSLSFAASEDAAASSVTVTGNVRLSPEALLFGEGDGPFVPSVME